MERLLVPRGTGCALQATQQQRRLAALVAELARTRTPGMQSAAIGYLLMYNVMFVVPLLAILAMTYFGVRSAILGTMLRKRLALAKFGMAALFAALGILVISTL
jgi:cytochrome b561